MICSSSASGEVGLVYTPSTVSSWDGLGIWHATTSAKEESVLKSSEKQRGKSSESCSLNVRKCFISLQL